MSVTSSSNLRSGGKKVIWKATCTFSFSGASSSGPGVTGTEDVTVTASSKLLSKGQSNVLVDGDSATGVAYGNKLEAKASGPLKSG